MTIFNSSNSIWAEARGQISAADGSFVYYWLYSLGIAFGLLVLREFSLAGRPVTLSSDSKLATNHRRAVAKRVQILEKLNAGPSGSFVEKSEQPDQDDLLHVDSDLTNTEESLWMPLIANSCQEIATISLAVGTDRARLAPIMDEMYKSMKKLSASAVSGDLLGTRVFRLFTHMLQTEVELRDGILDSLKALMTEAVQAKASGTLQVDSWGIFKQSEEKVKLLRFPVDKVPVILHAEYAAGLLTICGVNLEGADIVVATKEGGMRLEVLRSLKPSKTWYQRGSSQIELDENVVIMTLGPLRLSSQAAKRSGLLYVYAEVDIVVDEESFEVVSKAVHIQNAFWRTVLQLWVPVIAFWISVLYNTRALLLLISKWSAIHLLQSFVVTNGFTLLLLGYVFSRSIPNSFVDFVGYHTETVLRGIGQGLLVFYYGFRNLEGSTLGVYRRLNAPGVPPPKPPPPPPVPKETPAGLRTPPKPPPPPPMPKETPAGLRTPPKPSHSRSRGQVSFDEDGENAEVAGANSVDNPDWVWPAYDQFEDRYGKVDLKKRVEEVADVVSPFRVIYRRKANQVWPDVVQVSLSSGALINIVQKCLPNNGDLQCLEKPNVDGRDLFSILDDLKSQQGPSRGGDTMIGEAEAERDAGKGGIHLKHLVRFMDKEYKDVFVRVQRMKEEKRVTWDMLWAFLPPGKKVVYNCNYSQEMLAAVVSKYSHVLTSQGWALSIELDVWDYDGRSYHKAQVSRMIQKFDGERSFSGLAVRPIELQGVAPEILNESFLANGRLFHKLAMKNSYRFMHYSGALFQQRNSGSCWQIFKENADGRVMIDLASFAKMNPGYPMGNATPPISSGRAIYTGRGRQVWFDDGADAACIAPSTSATVAETELSDETLIFAPAIVYGFSFTLKQWGSFAIKGFSEISFDADAFDALVMESEMKGLVYNLVSQYIATPVHGSEPLQRVDPISNKGEGCIFLCYGPPGSGKTLTAESIAEKMRRPLWALSVSELGTTPNELEKTLFKVLDIAATWRAVLLFDEADVYLEKRTSTADLTRNAMTGVFLRLLEYYRGVLFLTTNRIGTFDDAFRSRISIFLRYRKLSIEHKEQVWRTLLERARVEGVTADSVSQLAARDLNGREIRNAIHTAQIWAKSNGQAPDLHHVRYVTSALESSLESLNQALQNPVEN